MPSLHPRLTRKAELFLKESTLSLALARQSTAFPLCLLSPKIHPVILMPTTIPSPPLFLHLQLQSSEQLLTQVEQLKRLHVLQDFEALNTELDQDVRALEAR